MRTACKTTQADTPDRLLYVQPERVMITDPAHPLFRREFVLAAVRGSVVNGHAVVVYRGDTLVRVPVSATDLRPASPRQPTSKLSLQAIRDLVRLAAPGSCVMPAETVGLPTVVQVGDAAGVAPPASPLARGGEL
jgi:hypothetical protein